MMNIVTKRKLISTFLTETDSVKIVEVGDIWVIMERLFLCN